MKIPGPKLMFDTNVLVDFTLIYYKQDTNSPLPKRLKNLKPVLDLFEETKVHNVFPLWSEFELRDILMNIKFQEICLQNGYTSREFTDADENDLYIPEEEKDGVNMIINGFKNNSQFSKSTKNIDFNRINKLSSRGFGFMDMVLIDQCKKNGCKYFVTKDKNLYKDQTLEKEFGTQIIHPNSLKNNMGLQNK